MEPLDLRQALLQAPLCKSLDLQEVNMVMDFSRLVSFVSGDKILSQGKMAEGVYIILEGSASAVSQVLGEGVYHVASLTTGDLIGEVSLIQNSPSFVSVIAENSVECLFIDKNYFETLSIFFHETRYKLNSIIANGICQRLVVMHKNIVSYMVQSKMVPQSFFSEWLKSFSHEAETTLLREHISLDYLRRQEIFKKFTEAELAFLLNKAVVTDAPSRCTLIKAKEKNEAAYFVLRGAVQSSIVHHNMTAKLSVLGPVSFLACVSCVSTASSVVNYSTCERAVLLKINKSNLDRIRKESPVIWFKIYDLITQSLAALEQAANKLDVRLHSELYNQ